MDPQAQGRREAGPPLSDTGRSSSPLSLNVEKGRVVLGPNGVDPNSPNKQSPTKKQCPVRHNSDLSSETPIVSLFALGLFSEREAQRRKIILPKRMKKKNQELVQGSHVTGEASVNQMARVVGLNLPPGSMRIIAWNCHGLS